MQKKLLLALLLLPSFILSASYPILAVSPSPTPSPTPPGIDEVTENLKKRLQDTLETPTSTPISSARAYVGIVKDIIKDTVVMQDKDGKKDIKLQEDTLILRSPGNTTIQSENIRIDDYIIALGYPSGDDLLTGRRLIVSADPIKPPAKTSGLGTILKIDKTSITLKLSDKDQLITLTSKTILKSSVSAIELGDLSVGDTLIYTAKIDTNDDLPAGKAGLTATILMRIQTASIE